MKSFLKLMICSLFILSSSSLIYSQESTSNDAHKQYAIVIGIDHYQDLAITPLASCRLDAVRFKSHLRRDDGLNIPKENIKLLLDPTKEFIESQLKELLSNIKDPANSSLFFYYSGHGINGGIVPTNYNQNTPESLLAYSWIKKQIRAVGVGSQIFIVDACYSGSLLTSKSGSDNPSQYIQAISEESKENIVVYTATNSYRVTPAGRHQSLYSKYFLEALENSNTDLNQDGIISSGELNSQLQENLGSLFAPQFYGDKEFVMAQLKGPSARQKVTSQKNLANQNNIKIARGQVIAKNRKLTSSIIEWRNAIENSEVTTEQANSIIKALNQQGDPESMAKIGFLYREGIGVKKDINKALSYFVSATQSGSGFAAYNLGYLFSQGIGMNKDIARAVVYYKRAAQNGDPYGQNNLGIAFSRKNNEQLTYDFEQAVYWLEKAAAQGNTNSQCTLGVLLKEKAAWTINRKQKQDYFKTAYSWLLKASQKGNARAQFELANCFEFGIGISKDTEAAKKWFVASCQNQELRACRKVMAIDYANNSPK